MGVSCRVPDAFSTVVQDSVEEAPVLGGQAIGILTALPVGELGVCADVVSDVAAAPLDDVHGQAPTILRSFLLGEVIRKGCKGWVEESEEGAERLLLAGVRGGCDQDEMARGVGREVGEQTMAQVGSPPPSGVRAGVGFVDDHEL